MIMKKQIVKGLSRNNSGFTLIEIIAVMVIIAIVAAVAISRGGSTAEATLKSAAEALKSHIRFAQMKALNSDAPNCAASVIMVISSESYLMRSVTNTCADTTNAVLPGAESSSGVNLPSGMTVTTASFSFDRWGRPCSDLSGTTLAPANIDLTLNYAGLPPENIKITKNTGFVQ